jgi:hypothetical protein
MVGGIGGDAQEDCEVAASPLARRTVLAAVAMIVAALTSVALPAFALERGPAASLVVDPGGADKHSKDPTCHPRPQCNTDPPPTQQPPTTGPPNPTPTATGGGPPQPGDSPPMGGGGPGQPGQSGMPGQSGQPGQSGGPGGAGGVRPGAVPGQGPAGVETSDGAATGQDGSGTDGHPKAAGPTSLVAAARPFWPLLGGGTLLIAVITTVLLFSLRDKPGLSAAVTEPIGSVEGPEQPVVSPRAPIRVDWVEPPD